MGRLSRMPTPERNAKPIGIIIISQEERDEFANLSTQQQGYFLHWSRSNPHCSGDWWRKAMRKAREQRP